MGVYIELYAPIFNYNSMSQVIKKFEPGGKTTQPRLYKRGNDDIDLDAYIRDAESEFSYWLANSRLKDKEKQQVQEAYSQMIQGINDGTFTYKIGGGYNNSVGMSNKTKGFDAAGLAAGFLGNILRNQSVYKAPEEKPDPSKIEWKGNSSVGSALVRHLYGSDKESLNDFIDLDPYDAKTKKRGNANRSARFKSELEYIRDNFDNLFTSFTDTDKANALEGINSALSAFENGTVEDNEYLELGRTTGMSNLRDMFFAGEKYGSTTAGTPTGGGTVAGGDTTTYTNEDEYKAAKHPRSTVTNFTNRSLPATAVYKKEGRTKLNQILLGLSKDALLKIVQLGLKYSPTGQELNKGRSILQGFGQLTSFENNFIIGQALKVLQRKGYLYQFPTDPNSFYVPFVSDKLDQRGTGFVYHISPDGNHSIKEMDRYDIPFFTTQWHNEFTAQVPSNKKGGILRKFQQGGWFENLYKQQALKNWNTGLSNANWTSGTTFHGNAGDLRSVAQANTNYTADQKAVGEDINSFVKTFDNFENLTPEQIRDLYNQNAEQIRNFWNQDIDYTTTDALAHNQLFRKMFANRSNMSGGNANYNLSYQEGDIEKQAGSQTWHRRMDRYEKEYDQLTDEEKQARTHTIIRTVNGQPQEFKIYKKANGDIELLSDPSNTTEGTTETPETETQIDVPEEHSDAWKKVFGVGKDQVNEKFLPPVNSIPRTGSFGNFMSELAPDLIGAGRLWASLHTNNKVYDTVLPSLKPVLKDTYERYSPVTGAFSARQLKNRQGADVLNQSHRPFTSDASLAAARMLEGQRQANQLQAEGFLADDQEIRRTQAEALARQEDNMARRSDVANFNRASINQTNRERAQLEATRLKSNWQSWDNFLQGFESRIRTRMDENRERANNFYDKLSANQAEEWYNTAMEPADRAYAAWQKANVGADPSTEWGENGSEWHKYVRHKREARARANSMIYQNMADRYGLHYTNPYTEESNTLFNWNRRYI